MPAGLSVCKTSVQNPVLIFYIDLLGFAEIEGSERRAKKTIEEELLSYSVAVLKGYPSSIIEKKRLCHKDIYPFTLNVSSSSVWIVDLVVEVVAA